MAAHAVNPMTLPLVVLAKMPAMVPPPGAMTNFSPTHHSLEKYVHLCAGVCLSLATLFALFRMYTKSFVLRNLDWSDYTCCLAWIGLVVDCTLGLVSLDYGLGVHQWNVNIPDFMNFLKYLYVMEIIFGPVIFLTEASLLLLYTKLFVANRKSATYVLIQIVLYANLLFYTGMTLAVIFMCTPVRKFWIRTLPGTCADSFAIIVVSAAFNVASNLATVVLPVRAVWQLTLPLKKKLAISTIFAAGLFACVASMMRLYLTAKDGHKADVTYNMTAIMLWTVAEITTGIICSCLPYMPQFLNHARTTLSTILTTRFPYSKRLSSISGSSPSRKPNNEPVNEKPSPRAADAEQRRFRHPNDLSTSMHGTANTASTATVNGTGTGEGKFSPLTTNASEVESVWGLPAAKRAMRSIFSPLSSASSSRGGRTYLQSATEKSMSTSTSSPTTVIASEGEDEKEFVGGERSMSDGGSAGVGNKVGAKEWV